MQTIKERTRKMDKLTFQTEQHYLDFCQTVCVFTQLRAYNCGVPLWKKEDLPFIKGLDSNKGSAPENLEYHKRCLEVWYKAESTYGNEVSVWREALRKTTLEQLLEGLGFDVDDIDSIEELIDLDVNSLKRSEYFPEMFPCVTCFNPDSNFGDVDTVHIYLNDFEKPSYTLDFEWLKENVREFWKGSQDK